MTGFVPITFSAMRLLVYLHKHNNEKFNFTALKKMQFFSNANRLNAFLNFCVARKIIKKTYERIDGRRNAFYEIKAEWNTFAAYLEELL